MIDTRSAWLMTIIIFWTLVTIFSNAYLPEAYRITGEAKDKVTDIQIGNNQTVFDKIQNALKENIITDVFDYFAPIIKILTFQYNNIIPSWLSLLLDILAIYSVYLIYAIIRSG